MKITVKVDGMEKPDLTSMLKFGFITTLIFVFMFAMVFCTW
jgi:hypothetical protein